MSEVVCVVKEGSVCGLGGLLVLVLVLVLVVVLILVLDRLA